MTVRRTYLDHNATSPLRPEARAAMLAALELTGNPSSVHAEGRAARSAIEKARAQVAALVGAKSGEVVFTSGATEANAMMLAGGYIYGGYWSSFACSSIEHPSVLEACPQSAQDTQMIQASPEGRIVIDDAFVRLISFNTASAMMMPPLLTSGQLVNGETGVEQDIGHLVEVCRATRQDVFVHTDAVQAVGRIPVDFKALGVDAMTLSSHKLGGPQGVGALILRDGHDLAPLIRGGGQERGRRAGTENVAGIAGFGAAAEAAARDLDTVAERTRGWQQRIEAGVREIAPHAQIIGDGAPRLPNTSCIAVPGKSAETLVIALDLAGIAVSAGSACSSGKVKQSHVLTAMGLPPEIAGSAIRVSTGWSTTDDDIDAFLTAFGKIVGSKDSLARKVA